MKMIKQKNICEVCGRLLTEKDYFELCRKCQPAWQKGREVGEKRIKNLIRSTLDAML